MIPKISRGSRPVGLFRYLIGPGAANEHVDPRLVAGSAELVRLAGGRKLIQSDASVLGRYVDEPRRQFGTEVSVVDRDADGKVTGRKPAHVWHCPLSLHVEEGEVDDEPWRQIAERFVAKMGFDDEHVADRCRWAAIRHGPSAHGSDHLHLVVGLVCENGRAAVVHNDRLRAQEACRELEREFGLRQVEGRGRGAGERAYTYRELRADERAGRRVRESGGWAPQNGSRQLLERLVRAAATASVSEQEFVERLRAERVLIRARFEKGSHTYAVGYSVALRPPKNGRPAWYPGGQLSRDLTLPRLRRGWKPTTAPVTAWQPRGRPRSRPIIDDPTLARRCVGELEALRGRLRAVPADDHGAWVQVAGDVAGILSAWSLRAETRPGPLAAAARSVARSAQVRTPPRARSRPPRAAVRTARLLLAAGGAGVSNQALITQLAGLADAIADMHREQRHVDRAAQLLAVTRFQLPRVASAVSGGLNVSTTPGVSLDPNRDHGIDR